MTPDRNRWYVIYTQPRLDVLAVSHVKRQGFETFLHGGPTCFTEWLLSGSQGAHLSIGEGGQAKILLQRLAGAVRATGMRVGLTLGLLTGCKLRKQLDG
ncbi:hypothetical protein [Xanthobacter flavus]|uniref:hypothetical protein n=1 Tax=Xanthobacter flavus TaxID=281 RepID=UPI00372AD65B